MAFNKTTIDVFSKGLDPTYPHKDIGPDGLLAVKQKTKAVSFELDSELQLKTKAFAARQIELELQKISETENTNNSVSEIVKKRPGRPKKNST